MQNKIQGQLMNTINNTAVTIFIQHSNKKGWSFDAYSHNMQPYGSGYRNTPQEALQKALQLSANPELFKEPDYYDEPVEWDISIMLTMKQPNMWLYEVHTSLPANHDSDTLLASGQAASPEQALNEALQTVN